MRGGRSQPDLIVVATDADCKGLVERLNEVKGGHREGSRAYYLRGPRPSHRAVVAA